MVYDSFSAITHQQLRVLIAVAREGTFVGAGRTLMLTEPAISNHVRTLERLVGTKLVFRSPGRRRAELTQAGLELLELSETSLRALEHGILGIRERHASSSTTITIGAPPDVAGSVLPRLIGSYRASHPEISIRIEAHSKPQALEVLSQGRCQLGVVLSPVDEPGLASEPFADAVIYLIGPLGHRLSGDQPADLRQLEGEPMIIIDRPTPPREAIERLFAGAGVSLNIVMEARDAHARVQAVIDGLGIAAVPLGAIRSQLSEGPERLQFSILNVRGFPIHMLREIAYRPDAIPRPAIEFKEFLQRHRADFETI